MPTAELLAPAGNLAKLKLAFLYGADAVYAGGKQFSLRAYADNFTNEELAEGIAYAHRLQKKVYVTVNIFAKNADLEEVKDYLAFLKQADADAVLVADPGILALAKNAGLTVHLSTQANTLNAGAALFWQAQGVSRVVLARELSLTEIAAIHAAAPSLELEAFVHGAMCVSYSGRCLLSNYMTKRDGNRGECVQACRWQYALTERARHSSEPIEVEEDARGTYFMSSKDLNLLAHLKDLADAGIVSFKIEGRMKTEFYLATVVNAYRRALDELETHGEIKNRNRYNEELRLISHRPYTAAYLSGATTDAHIAYEEERSASGAIFAAVVLGYEAGHATVEMRNRFRLGDTLEVLSPADAFGKSFTLTQILNADGAQIKDAKLVQETLRIPIPFAVQAGDMLRMRTKQ